MSMYQGVGPTSAPVVAVSVADWLTATVGGLAVSSTKKLSARAGAAVPPTTPDSASSPVMAAMASSRLLRPPADIVTVGLLNWCLPSQSLGPGQRHLSNPYSIANEAARPAPPDPAGAVKRWGGYPTAP